jgi:hypothetical protein
MSERPSLEYPQDRLMHMLRLALLAGSLLPRAAVTQSHNPVLDLVADWADHYGASAIYLRLNGVLPPTAKRSGASK